LQRLHAGPQLPGLAALIAVGPERVQQEVPTGAGRGGGQFRPAQQAVPESLQPEPGAQRQLSHGGLPTTGRSLSITAARCPGCRDEWGEEVRVSSFGISRLSRIVPPGLPTSSAFSRDSSGFHRLSHWLTRPRPLLATPAGKLTPTPENRPP